MTTPAAGDEVERLRAALRECIESLKEWGQLALSSDFSGPDDRGYLANDIARHKVALEGVTQ
jgi:hypothetical protein